MDLTAGIFIQQQAQSLKGAGLNLSIFMVEDRRLPFTGNGNRITNLLENGLPVYRLKVFSPPKRIRWLRWWWYFYWDQLMNFYQQKHAVLPQLLHAHGFVGGAAARYLSKKYNIPYLITEHYSGFLDNTVPRHWIPELSGIYDDAVEVIAVSTKLADSMKPYCHAVKVIPNMIDTNVFYPSIKQHAQVDDTRELISVGSLEPRKNFTTLLQVFAKLLAQHKLALTIIGDGPLKAILQKMAEDLKIDHAVTFTGNLPPGKVAQRMRSAHLYVSTSKVESFALAPVEALACGLPVVLLRCGSVLEQYDFDAVSLVDDQEQLASAIERNLREKNFKDKAFKQIKNSFGKEKIIEELKEVYTDVVDSWSSKKDR